MTEPKLLQCPFAKCGGEAKMCVAPGAGFVVECAECRTGGGEWLETEAEAAAHWNDRTPTPPAWQPIETVPKDGKLVILGAWRTPPWIGWFQSEDFYRWYMANRPFPPTHWMPCPDYPPRGSK